MQYIKCCPKCGKIYWLSFSPESCKYCEHSLIDTKYTFEDYVSLTKEIGDGVDKVIEEEYIINNPEFSEDAQQNRIKQEDIRYARINAEIETDRNPAKCPYCQSADVKKISTAGRAVSVGLFGLASKKIGKQWHCNKCKSDF